MKTADGDFFLLCSPLMYAIADSPPTKSPRGPRNAHQLRSRRAPKRGVRDRRFHGQQCQTTLNTGRPLCGISDSALGSALGQISMQAESANLSGRQSLKLE